MKPAGTANNNAWTIHPTTLTHRAAGSFARPFRMCAHRHWELLALHVRTTHVHVIVFAEAAPERILNDFKAYASRALNAAGLDAADCRRWTRHGSTLYLWTDASLDEKVHYVLHEQGEPMECYAATTSNQTAP